MKQEFYAQANKFGHNKLDTYFTSTAKTCKGIELAAKNAIETKSFFSDGITLFKQDYKLYVYRKDEKDGIYKPVTLTSGNYYTTIKNA